MELSEIIAKRVTEVLSTRDEQIKSLFENMASLGKKIADSNAALAAAEKRLEHFATKEFAQQAIDSIPTAEEVAAVIIDGNHIVTTVDAVASKWLQDNPPAPGKDGKDGENGRDGIDGKQGERGADGIGLAGAFINSDGGLVITMTNGESKFLGPVVGKDGESGLNGRDGIDGKDGENGSDGIGLAGAFINRDGELTITMTSGEVKCLGPVVGKDGGNGHDGKDGADGVGFDDLQVEADGEGGVTLKFLRGGIAKDFPLHFAVPTYRGYYREGRKVKAGNVVTHKGHAWIANRDAESTPCLENKEDWSLMVKAGRDGRDGYDGKNFGERTVKLGGAGEPSNAV